MASSSSSSSSPKLFGFSIGASYRELIKGVSPEELKAIGGKRSFVYLRPSSDKSKEIVPEEYKAWAFTIEVWRNGEVSRISCYSRWGAGIEVMITGQDTSPTVTSWAKGATREAGGEPKGLVLNMSTFLTTCQENNLHLLIPKTITDQIKTVFMQVDEKQGEAACNRLFQHELSSHTLVLRYDLLELKGCCASYTQSRKVLEAKSELERGKQVELPSFNVDEMKNFRNDIYSQLELFLPGLENAKNYEETRVVVSAIEATAVRLYNKYRHLPNYRDKKADVIIHANPIKKYLHATLASKEPAPLNPTQEKLAFIRETKPNDFIHVKKSELPLDEKKPHTFSKHADYIFVQELILVHESLSKVEESADVSSDSSLFRGAMDRVYQIGNLGSFSLTRSIELSVRSEQRRLLESSSSSSSSSTSSTHTGALSIPPYSGGPSSTPSYTGGSSTPPYIGGPSSTPSYTGGSSIPPYAGGTSTLYPSSSSSSSSSSKTKETITHPGGPDTYQYR